MTEQGRFSTKDLMALTDLTYRTVTDWDAKGIIPARRNYSKGWRRFTLEEVFVTLVCTEMRHQYGVSITSLRWLKDRLFEDEHGHLPKVLGLMQAFGSPVFIFTDLKTHFRVCSIVELMDAVITGFFDGENAVGHFLFKVNPLVNRLLTSLGATAIEENGLGYDMIWHILGKGIDQTPKEQELLETVRDGATSKVEVALDNGTIVQTSAERKFDKFDPEELVAALNREDFQTLTIKKQNGAIVGARQKIPGKPAKKHKRGSSRRRK